MCFICDVQRKVKEMTPDAALSAIAHTHRTIVARQLAEAPNTAAALFGEIPPDGCDVEMVVFRDTQAGSYVLTAQLAGGDKGFRITYALNDLNAHVRYTGNGPENASVIGVDAIDAALDYMASKSNGLGVLGEMGIEFGGQMHREIEMTQLVLRCLTALRERAVKDSATE